MGYVRTLELLAAALPAATEGDPERERDQPDVEPEAPAPDIDGVVAELLAPRDVAVGIDLGHPRQPGAHAVPLLVAGNFLDQHALAGGTHLHLLWHQCARTD